MIITTIIDMTINGMYRPNTVAGWFKHSLLSLLEQAIALRLKLTFSSRGMLAG